MRQLSDEIERGSRAIALAKERGVDTAEWEERLAVLELERLLEWSTSLADRDITLSDPVEYFETPLRHVNTGRVSFYARRYLSTIAGCRLGQITGLWRPPTEGWYQQQEAEAIGALRALRVALKNHEGVSDQC